MKKHGIVTIKTVNGLDVVSDFAPFWLEGSVINFELNGSIDASVIKAVHANFYFRETKTICIPVALLSCDTADSGNTIISADLREISMFYRRAGEKLNIVSFSHTNKILSAEAKKNGPDDDAMEEEMRNEEYACCF